MLPEAFLQRMAQQLGPQYSDYLSALDRPLVRGLRLNPLKTGAPPALPFRMSLVPWAEGGFFLEDDSRPGLHPYHEAGLYYLQEPSAMAPAALLAPGPGERVLDLCAAPGGKSTQLAAAMAGRGLLVCNEIDPKRARILARNVERMAVVNALVLNHDPRSLRGRLDGWFHRVLVDAPCSGEGMFRREAAALTDWSSEAVRMCARRQLEILDCAGDFVAPGGRLVYSTCTFSPDENEGVVSRFLERRPDFVLEAVPAPWFAPGSPVLVERPAPGLERTFRLWPQQLRGEGHFAAVFRRENGHAEEMPPRRADPLPAVCGDFLKELGLSLPEGKGLALGETLCWTPEELPELQGLRVLRAGLELGGLRKGRFEPSHALALWSRSAARTAELPPDGQEVLRYLRGETLPGGEAGWTQVTTGGLGLGWAKCSGGILKNHYPKGLRRV